MTDNEKKIDEDLQRAAEQFFAAKISQGYSPDPTDGRLTGAKLLGQAMTAPMGRAVVGPMTGRLQKFNWYSVRTIEQNGHDFCLE